MKHLLKKLLKTRGSAYRFPYLQALDGIQKLPLKSTEDKNELFR